MLNTWPWRPLVYKQIITVTLILSLVPNCKCNKSEIFEKKVLMYKSQYIHVKNICITTHFVMYLTIFTVSVLIDFYSMNLINAAVWNNLDAIY